VQRLIVEYLAARPGVFAWRQNTGGVFRGGRYIQYGLPGQADISGILRGGRRLEVEVKRPGVKDADPDQEAFRERIEDMGGLYVLADDVITVAHAIDQHVRSK